MQLETMAPREVILPITTDGFQFVARHRDRLSERFLIPPISGIDQLVSASDKLKLAEISVANEYPSAALKSTDGRKRAGDWAGRDDCEIPVAS